MADTVNKSISPLSRVVAAAAIDQYEDFASVEHRYTHWAARGLKKLQGELLKRPVRSSILRVNRNTMTAALPCGFDGEVFVGIINHKGEKVPIYINTNLVDLSNLEEEEEFCPTCCCKKGICDDLQVSENTTYVVIN